MKVQHVLLGLTRISIGWLFLWAFLDKLLGLGFTTCRDAETGMVETICDSAWVVGGSPTTGFLKFAAAGPFVDFYNLLAGSAFIDWLFMMGLLLIGASLLLGILTKVASWSGVLFMVLVFTAVLPPPHNPIVDDHIVYALILLMFTQLPVGDWGGLGKRWSQTRLVQSYPWLR